MTVRVIGKEGLEGLLRALREEGYTVVGPLVRDGAIHYGEIGSIGDLPEGYRDEQGAGRYRLRQEGDLFFGYAVGPGSPKYFLNPPERLLFRVSSDGRGVEEEDGDDPGFAFLVRPCDVAGISIRDRVLLEGEYRDPHYLRRREKSLIIAVNCTHPGGTCFCLSMGTGPEVGDGADLILTEVSGKEHYFLIQAGSQRGKGLLERIPSMEASPAQIREAEGLIEGAKGRMGRALERDGLKELLYRSHDHPYWRDVEKRCLACGNCTFVCPTCFCTTLEDRMALDGSAERWQRWDSCFTLDFTYLHGGSIRSSIASRYRHWITHKLATWIDQFGTPGCVGCGRCITWCPVGIDITEVVEELRKGGG